MIKIAMLSTGEEVLHGDIVDTNAAWLSRSFFEQGFSLHKRATVGDGLAVLTEELMMLSFNCDVVIVNGGLGPTSDDLSAEAAAKAADQPLVLFDAWLTRMTEFFLQRGIAMPESNKKQAMLPENSTIIDNPVGTACGFQLTINDCLFYFTPGVPSEFFLMVESQILPDLKLRYPETQGQSCNKLYTLGMSEAGLSEILSKIHLPEGYQLGYRSYMPYIEVKLFSPQQDTLNREKVQKVVYDNIKQWVVSIDASMLSHIGDLLDEKQMTIAVSEQATQGWLTHWLQSDDKVNQACGHCWVLSNDMVVGEGGQDELAATFALAGATRDKCSSDIALVTGKLTDKHFTLVLSAKEGEWGQSLAFRRTLSKEDQKSLIGTIAGDMLRRYLSNQSPFSQYLSLETGKQMHIPASML